MLTYGILVLTMMSSQQINEFDRKCSCDEIETKLSQLKSKKTEIRISAIRFFGDKKEKLALPHLLYLLKADDSWAVRSWAGWALGEIGDKVAIFPLIDAMEKSEIAMSNDPASKERKCWTEYRIALRAMTGQNLVSAKKWKNWWIKNSLTTK